MRLSAGVLRGSEVAQPHTGTRAGYCTGYGLMDLWNPALVINGCPLPETGGSINQSILLGTLSARGVAANRFVGRQELVAYKGLVLTLGSMITIPMVWSM